MSITLQCVANVLSVHEIDTANQTFRMELVIRSRTLGVPTAKTQSGDPVTIDNWEPRIRLLNLLESSKWNMSSKPGANGELEFKWTIAGTFSQTFDLSAFPVDRQDLSLSVSSAIPRYLLGPAAPSDAHERRQILDRLDKITDLEAQLASFNLSAKLRAAAQDNLFELRRTLQEQIQKKIVAEVLRFEAWPGKTSVVQVTNFCMSGIFELSGLMRMRSSQTYAHSSTTSTVRPLLVMSLSISRYRGSAFWNIEMPMGIITALGAGTFAGELSALERLGVSVTLLLTAVAYKSMVMADLPRISYLTEIDKYVVACFLAQSLVVVENSLCEHEPIASVDRQLGLAWFAAFVLYSMFYALRSLWQVYQRAHDCLRHRELALPTVGKVAEHMGAGDATASLLRHQ